MTVTIKGVKKKVPYKQKKKKLEEPAEVIVPPVPTVLDKNELEEQQVMRTELLM